MADVFAETMAVYRNAAGSQAYIKKEDGNEARRNAQAWSLVEGLDMRGWRVLDVGCGFGRDVAEFRRRGAEAYGVDASPLLLAEARKRLGGEDWWIDGDFRTLLSPPGNVPLDLLWCCAVLVHVPREELKLLLQRWWGWLKPGGRMVVITKEGQGQRQMDSLNGHPRVMVYYTTAEILEALGADAEVELRQDSTQAVALPTGDMLLQLRLRKS